MKATHKVKLAQSMYGYSAGTWVNAVPAFNLPDFGSYWMVQGKDANGTPWKDHPVGALLRADDITLVKEI